MEREIPSSGGEKREYPQKLEILWHGFNFLFRNLLKHSFKSKQNIATTAKPFFLLQLLEQQ